MNMDELEKLITTNLGQRTVLILHHTGTPEQADNTNYQLLKLLRKIRRSRVQFEYLAIQEVDGKPVKSVESKDWRKG